MRRNFWLVGALVLLLLAIPTSTAFAQGGSGDKLIIGQNYVLASGERLDGNLAMIGGNATLEAGSQVNGDVAVIGGALKIDGTVHGSIAVFGGAVALTDTAVVEGDLVTFGGSVQRAPGAVISGEAFQGPRLPEAPRLPEIPGIPAMPEMPRGVVSRSGPVDLLASIVRWQLSTLGWGLLLALLGVVAVLVAPKALERIASTAAGEPGLSLGVGLLTLIVGFLAGTLLLIVCGLGLLIWLAVWVAFIIGWIGIGLWVGQRLLSAFKARNVSSLGEVALGVFLITLLGRMPWCIGFLFTVSVGAIGLGAVVLTRFGTQSVGGGGTGRGVPQALPVTAGLTAEAQSITAPPIVVSEPETDAASVTEAAPQSEAAAGEVPPERVLAKDDLEVIVGVGPEYARRLRAAGVATFADLAAANPADLSTMIDVNVERILRDDWIGQARQLLGR
ncbi:MAG: hypothetical protein CVU38_16495 [Chloroflexi bacterium HGW-Chloroflexi-1]|nr:MAG: hypothetical protein CVU38_16495 [Chloroflexi bacterium HGW-Chloroflexi-1]